MSIMILRNSRGVAKPVGNLEQRLAFHDKEGRKCMSHHMRSHPRHALSRHVVSERLSEIVTVKAFSVPHVRPKHEGFSEPILAKEISQSLPHRDLSTALLFVESESRRVAQINDAMADQEPFRDSLDDLVFPQAGMESDVEDKAQILAVAFGNQTVAQLAVAKTNSRGSWRIKRAHSSRRVRPNLSGLHRPTQESAHRHDKLVRRGFAGRCQNLIVLALQGSRVDCFQAGIPGHGLNPAFKQPKLVVGRGASVFAIFALLTQMLAHFSQESRAGRQQRQFANLCGNFDRLLNIASLERNHRRPEPVLLPGLKVICVSAQENPAHRIVRVPHVAAVLGSTFRICKGFAKGVYRISAEGILEARRMGKLNPRSSLERANASPMNGSTFCAAPEPA